MIHIMERELRQHMRDAAERYASVFGIGPGRVAARAIGDARFFERLKAPQASFTVRTYDIFMLWLSSNWPAGLAWPPGIPRPEPSFKALAAIRRRKPKTRKPKPLPQPQEEAAA